MRRPWLTALITLFLTAQGIAFPARLFAAGYQVCPPSSSCTVGEFLYDDNYTPIATGSCTLTSRNPDNSLFLNSVPLTASSDGWYSYTATTSATEGVYHSQICCTTGSDYLCLDKTFEIKTPAATISSTLSASPTSGPTPVGL